MANYGDLHRKLTVNEISWTFGPSDVMEDGKELRYVDFMYVNDAPGTLTFNVHIWT